jgi:hypothetical protein
MKKIFVKIIIFSFAVTEVFLINLNFVKAASIPSPSEVAAQMEARYHVNLASVQNMGEEFNVSANKINAPEVMLFFTPPDPKEGETITAEALPMYFSNPAEKLYYTWYLVRKECRELTDSPSASEREICDKDSDGEITVNDWKVEAMSLIAQSGFEPESDTYSRGDNDHDGYEASYGGDDKSSVSDDTKHCYIHDFQRGIDAEMEDGCVHLFPKTNGHGSTGDGSFGIDEERFWGTNPRDPNTAANGNMDEANVVGLGQNKFSWIYQTGDKVGVAVEGTSIIATKYADASYMIMWALPKNDCSIGDETVSERIDCSGDKVAICAKTENGVTLIDGNSFNTNWCSYTGEDPVCADDSPICSIGDPVCVDSPLPTDNVINAASSCASLSLETPTCERETGTGSKIVQTGSKTVTQKGYTFLIPTTNININRCLDKNLVDPAEKTNEKLDISLSYIPENPVNDTSDDNLGDLLSVASSITNPAQDPSQIYYDWKISAGRSISGNFTDISSRLSNDGLISGKLSGINDPKIGISLNLGSDYGNYFDDGIGYLRVKVKAKESIPGKVRIGNAEVIIRINATGNRIKAYLTSSIDGNSLSRGNPICNETATSEDKMNYYICPVVKDQILRLEVDKDDMSDFSWSADGSSVTCDSSLSSDCSGGNIVFLPILGAQGDEIDVKMNAKNVTNGKSIELSKKFQIVEPYIKIISNDTNAFWPKLLGNYTDLDGNQYSDYSDSVFETYTGASASLTAEFHPTWLEQVGNLDSAWILDGEDNTDAANPKVINFTVTRNVGEAHNLTFSSFFTAPSEIRKILMNYWGVTQAGSSGELISNSASGEVVSDSSAGSLSFRSPTKFLASIISNLPGQAIFLLRTALIIFMVILMSGLALNFSADFNRKKP